MNKNLFPFIFLYLMMINLISGCDSQKTEESIMATSPQRVEEITANRVEENLLAKLNNLPVKAVLVESTLKGSRIRVLLNERSQWNPELKYNIQNIIEHWQKSFNTPVLVVSSKIFPNYLNSEEDIEEFIQANNRLREFDFMPQYKHALAIWSAAKISIYNVEQSGVSSTECLLLAPLEFYEIEKIKEIAQIDYDPLMSSILLKNNFEVSFSLGGEKVVSLTVKNFGTDYNPSDIKSNTGLHDQLYRECNKVANENFPEIMAFITYAQYSQTIKLTPNIAH